MPAGSSQPAGARARTSPRSSTPPTPPSPRELPRGRRVAGAPGRLLSRMGRPVPRQARQAARRGGPAVRAWSGPGLGLADPRFPGARSGAAALTRHDDNDVMIVPKGAPRAQPKPSQGPGTEMFFLRGGGKGDDAANLCARIQPKHSMASIPGCTTSAAAAAAAISDGEARARAASMKDGYAGPGPRSESFQGPSRRGGPGAWPPPARPSHRRRRRARRRRPEPRRTFL